MEYECKKKGCLHQSSSYSSIILATLLREHCALAFVDTINNLVKNDPKMFEISFKSKALLLTPFKSISDSMQKVP